MVLSRKPRLLIRWEIFREKITPEHLSTYITEAGNPGNRKQVARVEVAYPSPLLANGIILIDTPGIGSTHLHNTETTEQYLESVDGAIVVLSVDPPITEAESDFLKRMRGDIPKLFFILNKTDLVSENDASAIKQLLKVELDRLQFASPEIFLLSARSKRKSARIPRPMDTASVHLSSACRSLSYRRNARPSLVLLALTCCR